MTAYHKEQSREAACPSRGAWTSQHTQPRSRDRQASALCKV